MRVRARVAMAAVSENWPLGKVREVVAQALDNRVWDTDPSEPGLQLPAPKADPAPQPGRLVTRTEKWSDEIDAWQQEFAQIDADKLSKQQVQRLRAAVQKVRGQLEQLEKALGQAVAHAQSDADTRHRLKTLLVRKFTPPVAPTSPQPA